MKVAISVPDSVFEAAERLAQRRSIPRSKLYAEALSAYVDAQSDAAITENLNEVYAANAPELEPAYATAQAQVLHDEAW